MQYYDYGASSTTRTTERRGLSTWRPGAPAAALRAAPGVRKWQLCVNEAALAARAWAPLDAGCDRTAEPAPYPRRVTVAGGFKAFWEATGESGYLGNPVSEPYKVDVTYQVFERYADAAQRRAAGDGADRQDDGRAPATRHDPERPGLPVYSEGFTPPMTTVSGAPADPNGEKCRSTSRCSTCGPTKAIRCSGRDTSARGRRSSPHRPAATPSSPSSRHRQWRAFWVGVLQRAGRAGRVVFH